MERNMEIKMDVNMGRDKCRRKSAGIYVCECAWIYIVWLSPPRGLTSSSNPIEARKTWFLNIQSLVPKYHSPQKGTRLFREITDSWTGTGKVQDVFGTWCFAKKKGSAQRMTGPWHRGAGSLRLLLATSKVVTKWIMKNLEVQQIQINTWTNQMFMRSLIFT